MNLNFYAEIDSFKNDNKDNTSITLKAQGPSLDHALDKLRDLKNDSVVRIVIESAKIHYSKTEDLETGEDTVIYERDDGGTWQAIEQEPTSLTLDGVPDTSEAVCEITADVVDDFLLTQKYPVDPKAKFKPTKALVLIAEGYSLSEVAEKLKLSVTTMLTRLNQAREDYAPYAAAWRKEVLANEGD